jgi:hypothetical protein
MKDHPENPAEESEEIKTRLQINASLNTITNDLSDSLEKSNAFFSSKGPCSSIQLIPYPDKYFVAQEFNSNKDDLRESIEDALKRFGYTSIGAGDQYLSEPILCKIAALIQSTPFGVYQLTKSQNRNVYLELGIAIGFGRSFILVKERDAEPAKIIQDVEYYPIDTYLDIRYNLGELLESYMTSIGKSQFKRIDFDNSNKDVVLYHGDAESVDITIVVAKEIKNLGLTPVILGKFQENLAKYLQSEVDVKPKFIESRDQILEAIQRSKFGVFRIHKSASADNFVALGFSIGLNKPFLGIRHLGEDIPSDLSYLPSIDYSGYTELKRIINMQLQSWLNGLED